MLIIINNLVKERVRYVRIVVNDIAADKGSGGAFSVLREFYQAVSEHGQDHEWIFLLADNYFEPLEHIVIKTFPDIKKSWIKRLIFDQVSGHKIVNELKPDVYFSMQNIAMKHLNCPQATYLHQSLPFQDKKSFSFFKRSELKLAIYQKIIGRLLKNSLNYANVVFVQTEWMKRAIEVDELAHFVMVVPPTISLGGLQPNEFHSDRFFYPAENHLYKNHSLIYEATSLLNQRGYEKFDVFLTIDPQDVASNNVKFIGKIDRSLVFDYYANSILLFPSYIETFGLPLLEARTANAIILAADTQFAREILADYPNAYFYEFQDAEALSNLMEQLITCQISPVYPVVSKEKTTMGTNSWQLIMKELIKLGGQHETITTP